MMAQVMFLTFVFCFLCFALPACVGMLAKSLKERSEDHVILFGIVAVLTGIAAFGTVCRVCFLLSQ